MKKVNYTITADSFDLDSELTRLLRSFKKDRKAPISMFDITDTPYHIAKKIAPRSVTTYAMALSSSLYIQDETEIWWRSGFFGDTGSCFVLNEDEELNSAEGYYIQGLLLQYAVDQGKAGLHTLWTRKPICNAYRVYNGVCYFPVGRFFSVYDGNLLLTFNHYMRRENKILIDDLYPQLGGMLDSSGRSHMEVVRLKLSVAESRVYVNEDEALAHYNPSFQRPISLETHEIDIDIPYPSSYIDERLKDVCY